MKSSEIENGEEYWSERIQKRVRVDWVSNGYAHVRDEDNNTYDVHVSTLRDLDWDIPTIIEREG